MSDPPQPPPPKPKPGSLRDRIAAFEKPNASAAAPAPSRPPVRPKPGNVSWKPAPPEPTPSTATTAMSENEEQKRGGMSASDAKESIGRGGSLKERMAALQGKGAFGGGSPVTPPPVGPKPVKRPPLVVPTPPADEDEEHRDEHEREKPQDDPKQDEDHHDNDVPTTSKAEDDATSPKEEKDEPVEEEQDEETKERERRAAIAARMARLGGARVGMGPPVFAKKPEIKPKPKEVREEPKEEREVKSVSPQQDETPEPQAVRRDSAASAVSATGSAKAVSSPEAKEESSIEVPQPAIDDEASSKDSGVESPQSSIPKAHSPPETRPSLDSTSSQSSTNTSRSPPSSMPLPAAPKRAGPPRKRSAKNIKAQAAKQDDAATEVPPIPSSHEEPATIPAPAAEPEAETEVLSGKEESAQEKPNPPSDSSVGQDKVVGEHIAAAEESEEEVPPVSLAHDESHERRPESPENAQQVNQKDEAIAATLPQEDDDATPESRSEAEARTPTPTAQERDVPDSVVENPMVPDTETDEPPAIVKSPTPDDSIHSTSPLADEENADVDAGELAPASSTEVDSSPQPSAPEPATPESNKFPGSTIVKEEPEESQIKATEEESAEDEEAARRKRIAERMAKMGGRNPFAATPPTSSAAPVRKASVEQAPPAHVPEQEETRNARRDSHDDDIPRGQEVITGSAAASEVNEDLYLEPRVSSVAEVHAQDKDVPGFEAPPLDEHEDTVSERKVSPEPLIPVSDEHPAPEPLPESPLVEDLDEMAPPRIARPIPPLPSQAHVDDAPVSPTATGPKRASIRRSLPPPPQEPTASVLDQDDTAPMVLDKVEESLRQESVAPGHGDTSPLDSIPPSPSAEKEQQEDVERDSPTISELPTPLRSVSPQTVPNVLSSAIPSTQSPISAASETSRRSIPPPVPRAISPTSPRRAVSPPARAPPVPSPRPVSPLAGTVASPSASVRRSIPPPPRRTPSNPPEESAGSLPTRRASQHSQEPVPAAKRSSSPFVREVGGVVPEADDREAAVNRGSIEEQEILDDSEPDPIDPSFYSPPRSPVAGRPHSQGAFALPTDLGDPTEEDSEQARRRTIAERMAKLGGIKFGAPPPVPHKPPVVVPSEAPAKDVTGDDGTENVDDESTEPDSEEAERARRQAISARLAGMGGMRFGMLPQVSKPAHPRVSSGDSSRTIEAPPPQQPATPPAPESSTSEADLESEDGVKVEAGSELSIEEVTVEDAVEEPEELPPPVPSRATRQSHGETPPPLPGGRRPPIPAFAHPSRPPVPSTQAKRSSTSDSTRKASGGSLPPAPQSSDFVVVEDPNERDEVPPPPPSRAARPPRSIPPPPPQAASSTSSTREISTSQWELPDIPSSSFDLNVGGGLGLDSSFTSEDSTTYPPASPSPPPTARRTEPPPPPAKPAAPPPEVQLSGDELLQLWGVVGTAVHSAAASLYDKSKKTVIGDGTSNGFVMAALAQVPQASKASYGHLVYSQNAHAVLRRSSNIMPGDIIQLTEAKLKGHKGLQSYNQTVGTAKEPLVAIVSEFDTKKSKVKVFQANQHVGAQTVETASYRLEDLKSGNVKVFRVAST